MTQFELFFEVGITHILDVLGYDHILFVIVLCAAFSLNQWNKILWMVTSFTVGHSVTLFLASTGWIRVDSVLTEQLIALTILMAAIGNLFIKNENFLSHRNFSLNYLFAGAAGLIHGLGFSGQFKSMLSGGESVVPILFAFNIGLEVGQIIIVLVYVLITFIAVSLIGVRTRDWRFFLSSLIAGVALTLIFDRL